MKKALMLAAAVMAPAAASAQSIDEVVAYRAAMLTPAGALAPMLTNTLIGRAQNGAALGLRYGNLPSGNFNNTQNTFAVTGVLPAGLGASFRLTGGVLLIDEGPPIAGNPTSNDSPGRLMLGLGGDMRLASRSLGSTATSPLFTLLLDGEVGYANTDPGSAFSGTVSAPMALVQRGNGMQFVPFVTPAFVIGQISSGGTSENASGMLIGGGLGIYNTESSVMINVGIQHSFMSGAKNSIGVNLVFGGK